MDLTTEYLRNLTDRVVMALADNGKFRNLNLTNESGEYYLELVFLGKNIWGRTSEIPIDSDPCEKPYTFRMFKSLVSRFGLMAGRGDVVLDKLGVDSFEELEINLTLMGY